MTERVKIIEHPIEDGAYAPGSVLWFEYHCWEHPDSADAPAWYRSHQLVTVLSLEVNESAGMTATERSEAAMPFTYTARFADGLQWCVFEDELSTSQDSWDRPDPPTARHDESRSGTRSQPEHSGQHITGIEA